MGSVRFFLYKFSKLLPKKERKPIILFANILGVCICFQVMLNTTHSKYLYNILDGIGSFKAMLFDTMNPIIIFAAITMIVYLMAKRKWKQTMYAINGSYVIIMILAFLPMLE